jgi:hypothetical protein
MSTTALAIIEPEELDTIQRTGKLLAASGYFNASGDLSTQIAQMAAKIMAGREMGFGPFASVNGIYIIQGKPAISANLMASAVKGHPRYDYRVRTMQPDKVEIEFFEDGQSLGVSIFTDADAKSAGLTDGKNADTWRRYRRNMLFARAMSNGVRWYCPDCFSGNAVYVPEELGATVDDQGNVVDVGHPLGPDVIFENTPVEPTRTTTTNPDTQHSPIVGTTGAPALAGHISSAGAYSDLATHLTGNCAAFAGWCKQKQIDSRGPATAEQYQYLSGVIDAIVDKQHAHNAILEVLVGRPVTSSNPPGFDLANSLLNWLPAEQHGEVNPKHKADYVSCIRSIWDLVLQADGQQQLFEVAS